MIERRELMLTSAAAAAAAALPAQALAESLAPTRAIAAVLVDPRYADSVAFAAAARTRGAQVFSLEDDDLGRLWRGALGEHFAAHSGAVAGMTSHTELFISSTFAAEQARRRLVFEAMHDSRAGLGLNHRIRASAAYAGAAAEIAAAGPAWPDRLGAWLCARPAAPGPLAHEAVRGPKAAAHPGTLFTWVITKRRA